MRSKRSARGSPGALTKDADSSAAPRRRESYPRLCVWASAGRTRPLGNSGALTFKTLQARLWLVRYHCSTFPAWKNRVGASKNPRARAAPSPVRSGCSQGTWEHSFWGSPAEHQGRQSPRRTARAFVSQHLLAQSLLRGVFHYKHDIIFVVLKRTLLAVVCSGGDFTLKGVRWRLLVGKPVRSGTLSGRA